MDYAGAETDVPDGDLGVGAIDCHLRDHLACGGTIPAPRHRSEKSAVGRVCTEPSGSSSIDPVSRAANQQRPINRGKPPARDRVEGPARHWLLVLLSRPAPTRTEGLARAGIGAGAAIAGRVSGAAHGNPIVVRRENHDRESSAMVGSAPALEPLEPFHAPASQKGFPDGVPAESYKPDRPSLHAHGRTLHIPDLGTTGGPLTPIPTPIDT